MPHSGRSPLAIEALIPTQRATFLPISSLSRSPLAIEALIPTFLGGKTCYTLLFCRSPLAIEALIPTAPPWNPVVARAKIAISASAICHPLLRRVFF